MAKKTKAPFDFLKDLTERKTPWNKLSEMDKKAFSPYLINLFLSMNPDLLEFVNDMQRYTIGRMSPKQVYQLYYDFLPKMKLPYHKFIKGKKDDKYNPELVKLFALHFLSSERDAIDCLDMLYHIDKKGGNVKEIVSKYGKTEKEIKKLMKK